MRALPTLVLLLAAGGCAYGGTDDKTDVARADFVVDLIRLGHDVEYGRVGLERADGKTRVLIEVTEPTSSQLTAEIHTGNCDVLGVAAYSLEPVLEGGSATVVDVPVAELRRAGYTVMVTEPGERPGGLCGDLAQSQPPDAAPTFD